MNAVHDHLILLVGAVVLVLAVCVDVVCWLAARSPLADNSGQVES